METISARPPEIQQYYDAKLLITPMPNVIHKLYSEKSIESFSLEELLREKYLEMLGFPKAIGYRFAQNPAILNDAWVQNLRGAYGL